MATQTTLTLEQFFALPECEADGTRYELSEGELITLPPPGYPHGVFIMNLGRILGAALDRKKYVISGGDVGLILKSDPAAATVRGADAAVHERQKVEPIAPSGYQAVAPLLAIEVVSPGNSAADIELKVRQYLNAGTAEVWLLYPDTRRLYVFLRGAREAKVYEEHERFTSVVGCEFAVAPFFEL